MPAAEQGSPVVRRRGSSRPTVGKLSRSYASRRVSGVIGISCRTRSLIRTLCSLAARVSRSHARTRRSSAAAAGPGSSSCCKPSGSAIGIRASVSASIPLDFACRCRNLRRSAALADGSGTSARSVAAAFGLSYGKLDETSARLFRLLPLNPGPDISTAAAAALTGLTIRETRTVLGALARAHLAETAPGTTGRWRMHDLVRLYATRLGEQHAEADGLQAAGDHLLGYYLDTADTADDHLRALPGTAAPDRFTGRDDALAWLDAERPSLIATVTMAAATGRDQVAMHLPLHLTQYLRWRRRLDDWLAVAAVSLDAARRLGDRQGEGHALTSLGNALQAVRRFEEAITACQDAAGIYRDTGDRHREGGALNNLGLALQEVSRFEEAITAHQDAATIFRNTCGVPEVCLACELWRWPGSAVGHHDHPCPCACSISSSSGSAAGWFCSAGHRPPRTPSSWCCGMRSPCCAVPIRSPGSTGPTVRS